MTAITDLYIGNPVFPYTYFPFDKKAQRVTAMLLYTELYKDPGNPKSQYIRDLTSAEIADMVTAIKTELKLNHLDFGDACGRCYLDIGIADLPRVYEIARSFVSRGHHIYMQDGTQVTFPTFCQPSHELQQRLYLKTLFNLQEMNHLDIVTSCWHRSKFWTSPEGQELAAEYRQSKGLPDTKTNFIGEYFAEP